MYIPKCGYFIGIAQMWGWNWYKEAMERGAPQEVWRREDGYPRSRYLRNIGLASQHDVLSALRVPSIANYIRSNKLYRVGDKETACEQPESSPRCRDNCHHIKSGYILKTLKRKHGLIGAPSVEPEKEYGGID